jgi:hypothetical protein
LRIKAELTEKAKEEEKWLATLKAR